MPISEYKVLPWVVTCDECGEGMGGDGDGVYVLYDTRQAAVEDADVYGWQIADGAVTCEGCLYDKRSDEGWASRELDKVAEETKRPISDITKFRAVPGEPQ